MKSDDVKDTTHLVDGLSSGNTYRFTISTIGTNGRESVRSSAITQTTSKNSSFQIQKGFVNSVGTKEETLLLCVWGERDAGG